MLKFTAGDKYLAIEPLEEKSTPEDCLRYVNELVSEPCLFLSFNRSPTIEEENCWFGGQVEGIRNRNAICLVVLDEARIVGMVDVKLKKGSCNHVAEVGISVLKEYRGKGVGTLLLETSIRYARENLKPVPVAFRLLTQSNNAVALSLYDKAGFAEVARVPNQIQHEDDLVDEVIMLRPA